MERCCREVYVRRIERRARRLSGTPSHDPKSVRAPPSSSVRSPLVGHLEALVELRKSCSETCESELGVYSKLNGVDGRTRPFLYSFVNLAAPPTRLTCTFDAYDYTYASPSVRACACPLRLFTCLPSADAAAAASRANQCSEIN